MTINIKSDIAEKLGFAILAFEKFIILEGDITGGTYENERKFKNSYLTMCFSMLQERYKPEELSEVAMEDIQEYFNSLSEKTA